MQSPLSSQVVAAIVEQLAVDGIAVVAALLPKGVITALRAEGLKRDAAGRLGAAGMGRGEVRTVREDVLGDRIGWLDERDAVPPERILLAALEALRIAVNRELTLGLWRYEGHYALYPPGARYARHVDRFRDDDARVLSVILYLNKDWRGRWGALRIGRRAGPARRASQRWNARAFLAAEFERSAAGHAFAACGGWFHTRSNDTMTAQCRFPHLQCPRSPRGS
jgi:SM-20-related protein